MSLTKGSRSSDGEATASGEIAPAHSFTLRDLFERATISGNSLASELGLYLYTYHETVSLNSEETAQTGESGDRVTVHEMALAGILEVIVSEPKASVEVIRAPAPPGGVQEWWARMLSGSMNESQSMG